MLMRQVRLAHCGVRVSLAWVPLVGAQASLGAYKERAEHQGVSAYLY